MNENIFTTRQKLCAIAAKYYQHLEWHPKKGDYYTIVRDDLTLFQIVDEDEYSFYTKIVYSEEGMISANAEEWPKEEFIKEGSFWEMRVYVPDWVMDDTFNES